LNHRTQPAPSQLSTVSTQNGHQLQVISTGST
jgi:hypothetical protein